MGTTFHILLHVVMLVYLSDAVSYSICNSPQYLEAGSAGVIDCTFHDFYGVVWYNSRDISKKQPFLQFMNGLIEGVGYTSGEFDIFQNGSLIINNVTLQHDHNFTVLEFESERGLPHHLEVLVVVTIRPSATVPTINLCGNENPTCIKKIKENSEIICSLQNARPPVNLTWVTRTPTGDMENAFQMSVINKGYVFTTHATIAAIFGKSRLLSLLVCKPEGPPNMFLEKEATILVQDEGIVWSSLNPVKKYVEINTQLELSCSKTDISLIVWKKINEHHHSSHVLSFAALYDTNVLKLYSDEYVLQSDGALIVPRMEFAHEGKYGCIFESQNAANKELFDVVVFVPAYPIVQGCPRDHPCALFVQSEGNLTCSVYQIRPKVNLEWKTAKESDSSLISFHDQRESSEKIGDLFDIVLTSHYRVEQRTTKKLTVECMITGSNILALKRKTSLDILIDPVDELEVTRNNIHPWILAVIVGLCIVVIVFVGCYCKRRKKRKQMSNSVKYTGKQREQHIRNVDKEEAIPMVNKQNTKDPTPDPKDVLLKELKTRYKMQYMAVQPVPFRIDHLISVESVFINGKMERMTSQTRAKPTTRKELNSYHDVITTSPNSSNRIIIEGDVGYGKTILTLQMAYDWCVGDKPSPLANVDILILLKLRQLQNVESIWHAIKFVLLPKDSVLNETDIKTIISQSKSTVIIFDGFDEHPGAVTGDVNDIIVCDMLQDCTVIVTTRSSILPNRFPPDTVRIKLTGFNKKCRDAYIQKVVDSKEGNEYDDIELILNSNPLLRALCEVPLFFVMFVHIVYKWKEWSNITSVTELFRYTIDCICNHMENKMTDKNVTMSRLDETKQRRIHQVAFESISGDIKVIWEKDELLKLLDQECYKYYEQMGMLVEERSVAEQGLRYDKVRVKFFHTIFCEWYAAHYLSSTICETDTNLTKLFENLDHFKHQYLYRFACGLSADSARKIIAHLKGTENKRKLAILCTLEQGPTETEVGDGIRALCSEKITIDKNDSELMQWSTIQLFKEGSTNQIHISCLRLENCFLSANQHPPSIYLQSNLHIPVLGTLKELVITASDREMTREDAEGILLYSSQCGHMKSLRFQACLVPETIQQKVIAEMKTKQIKVYWCLRSDYLDYRLNFKDGRWEKTQSGITMTTAEYKKQVEYFRAKYGHSLK